MTREEAVNVLRNTWLNAGRVNGKTVFAEALNMAIRALETQPDGDAISRRVAIDTIKDADVCVCYSENESVEIENVIDLTIRATKGSVIEGIKQLPSAQPDLQPTCNKLATDTISRQAVKEIRNDGTYIGYSLFPDDDNADYENGFTDAINKVLALPSAQPDLSSYSDKLWRNAYERGKAEAQAEIVRCKDCKHHRQNYAGDSWCGHPKGLDGFKLMPNDFCSAAERRTDEQTD